MSPGCLYYVMGPSGAGKDSVLGWVREHGATHGVLYAHRYITRPADAGGENHVALSVPEFRSRERHGLFALTWEAHGLCYGIGNEVAHWLSRGADVLVNGSRGAFARACERFPALRPVLITANPRVIASRLAARGRESEDEIVARMARLNDYPVPPGSVVIRNDGCLADAGACLLQTICAEHSCRSD